VPRRVGVFGRDRSWSFGRTRLLAYFIAEGGLSGLTPDFTNSDPIISSDFIQILKQEFPAVRAVYADDTGITWRVSRIPPDQILRDRLNPVTDWLDKLGLMGKRSREKTLPPIVWRWDRPRLAEFIRALFSCDATIYSMSSYPRIEFTVASKVLADEVQHALTRFGIVSKFWQKTEASWRVEITEPESVSIYQREIGWIGEKTTRFTTVGVDLKSDGRRRRSNLGHPPQAAWAHVRAAAEQHELTLSEMARRAGEHVSDGWNPHTARGVPRQRLEAYAAALDDSHLARLASPDLYWDEIVAIEFAGQQQVYDLSVPDGANFVAQDIILHNTSLAVNMAENAAIRHKVPSAIFSLEMSKEQLALRLLCSQSEVALHKLRSGFLGHEDWPRLTTGAGLLNQAPIMIDDSAAPTVLEIRAKCRRLKSENKLGLVLIDYLQLIRPSGRAENRVQEISQITRNLKALAKELEVPVIALSQLSRAVDSRTGGDRRPQLSDLRESGSIEQDADVVMFVFREEYYKRDDPTLKGKAEIIVAKQRNGPTGEVEMTFLHEFTKFVEGVNLMPGETEPGF
jgi:replicative DNA helicase